LIKDNASHWGTFIVDKIYFDCNNTQIRSDFSEKELFAVDRILEIEKELLTE
jgi:hypothetical protein